MGTSTSRYKKFELPSEQELEFYIDIVDPHLGPVSIYTTRKYHLCYILKLESESDDTKIYNIFKKVENNQMQTLLALHGFKIDRMSCCERVVKEKIVSFWEYYNFYLDQYLARRCQQNLMMIDSEIWHIVEVCCETFNVFRKFGVYYEISPEFFVITPEGKLKAFWSHLKSQNHHMKFFQYFHENHLQRFAYSPEELECIHENERTTKINFEKCNSFRLGILLLQCLTLTNPLSNCYNPSMTSINTISIRNLITHKVVPNYSSEIVNLVRSLLHENPQKRPNLSEIYQEYFNRFSNDFELRVCGARVPESGSDSYMMDEIGSLGKKGFDYSDAKTVKISHSIRKN